MNLFSKKVVVGEFILRQTPESQRSKKDFINQKHSNHGY